MDWDSQLKQEERETMIASTIVNNIIESIKEKLHGANLVKEFVLGFLPNVKQLEQ